MKRRKKKPRTIIIETAQARAGLEGQTERLCWMANIPMSTYQRWRASGEYSLRGLKNLDKVLHFTEPECAKLIRG